MLLIVDGSSIGSRAFYSEPVNFFNMVESVRQETDSEYIVFCFDDDKPGFRQKLYPEYKGSRLRDKDRQDFITSVAVALEKTGFEVHWGPEADDVIGGITFGSKLTELQPEVYIFSSDTDLWQLVRDGQVYCIWCGRHFKDRKKITETEVMDRFGVPPWLIPDYIGLAGESSDNIPGVRGVGEKTARSLLQAYGSAHDIFEYGDVGGRYEKKVLSLEGRADFELSKTLATIRQQPITIDWSKAKYRPLGKAVRRWLKDEA